MSSGSSSPTLKGGKDAEAVNSHPDPVELIGQEGVDTLTRIATEESIHKGRKVGQPARRLASVTEGDETLNPRSPRFDLRKWLNAAMNDNAIKGQKDHDMGIIFRKLNIFGTGAALQYQETVTSMFVGPFRLMRKLFQRSSPRRHILHDFDGVLKSGELLLVLGRPGSGCTTFLKSLCGELHGLQLGKESTVHYNGM